MQIYLFMKVTTMNIRLLLLFIFLTLSFSCQAQLYKWVGPDGRINYTDTPPPKSVTSVETKNYALSEGSVTLPFALAQAVKNMPVTLYTSVQCGVCAEARNFLKQNGIPFSEKTISNNEDIAKLRQVSGNAQVPFLLIGKTKLTGYSATEWRTNLSQAGYPESSQLPADYQFSLPQPAAPAPVHANSEISDQPKPPEAPPRDPDGFQF